MAPDLTGSSSLADAAALGLPTLAGVLAGAQDEVPSPFTCKLRGPDGAEREIGCTTFADGGWSAVGWPLPRPPFPLETSLPGVFAAGDVRHRSVKRVASAVGKGSIAVTQVTRYLHEQGSVPT